MMAPLKAAHIGIAIGKKVLKFTKGQLQHIDG